MFAFTDVHSFLEFLQPLLEFIVGFFYLFTGAGEEGRIPLFFVPCRHTHRDASAERLAGRLCFLCFLYVISV